MDRKILKLSDVSERTGVPLPTLRYLRHQGRGPRTFVLAGRVVAFEDDVEAWLQRQAEATAVGGVA